MNAFIAFTQICKQHEKPDVHIKTILAVNQLRKVRDLTDQGLSVVIITENGDAIYIQESMDEIWVQLKPSMIFA